MAEPAIPLPGHHCHLLIFPEAVSSPRAALPSNLLSYPPPQLGSALNQNFTLEPLLICRDSSGFCCSEDTGDALDGGQTLEEEHT
mmetsp:Transcript_16725/g.29278  ORF Transcript_16725/g.29278 Transcript_16725/m.29278 type:complete len:85 (+) Transcript_16725:1017-1271(+)